jgi:hypothetical protein
MSTTAASDFQVRGYTIQAAMAYLKEIQGEAEAARIVGALSPETRAAIAKAEAAAAAWGPVGPLSDLLNAIAATGKGDEDKARSLMVGCGTFMAREATNTFLRLLMRMLTPTLFAKKLPDLWRRDCTHGTLSVDVGEQKFQCRVSGAQGFAHAPCTIAGFITFTLQTMGKSIDKTAINGWSLATPSPSEAVIEMTWKT